MRRVFRDDNAGISSLNARRWFACMEVQLAEISMAYSSRSTRREDAPKLKELYDEAREIFDGVREDYRIWNRIVRNIISDLSFNQRRESTLDRRLERAEMSPEDHAEVLRIGLSISEAGLKLQNLYIEGLDIIQRKSNMD